MRELWIGQVRCYFNAYTEAPLFWSVDNGDPATEVKCSGIVFHGNFDTLVNAKSAVQPRAWVQCLTAKVYQRQDGAIVVVDLRSF